MKYLKIHHYNDTSDDWEIDYDGEEDLDTMLISEWEGVE